MVNERDKTVKLCLIVDDSRVVRKVARRILEGIGFACDEAGDGQKAYEICQKAMPDIILLDWNMPTMSGFEFLERLRQTDGGMAPKVIFCTTESDYAHIERAMQSGADEYIMKPFDSGIIKSKLTRLGLMPETP